MSRQMLTNKESTSAGSFYLEKSRIFQVFIDF